MKKDVDYAYNKHGGLYIVSHYNKFSQLHNENGPSRIVYSDDSSYVQYYYYHKNGLLHNENGPAFIYYSSAYKIYEEKYFIDNKLHRLDGPAIIHYYESGRVKDKYFYINQCPITNCKTLKEFKLYLKTLCLN